LRAEKPKLVDWGALALDMDDHEESRHVFYDRFTNSGHRSVLRWLEILRWLGSADIWRIIGHPNQAREILEPLV
jgi:hypothetical protein